MTALNSAVTVTIAISALFADHGATPRCQIAPPLNPNPAPVPQPDPLDAIMPKVKQKELGWDKLTTSERAATATFIKEQQRSAAALRTRLDAEDAADRVDAEQTGWSDARAHLEREGWIQLRCEIVDVAGKEFFVVSKRFSSYKTSDIPFRLSRIGMRSARPNGNFWCKEVRFSGGIYEILVGGEQHSFRFADWSDAN